ncbi:hypothetical protein C3Y87_06230 [Carbonactinospora thermoautotrophica]|nr:hypothetical protein [Carbonactinospora thermoautotrophica]
MPRGSRLGADAQPASRHAALGGSTRGAGARQLAGTSATPTLSATASNGPVRDIQMCSLRRCGNAGAVRIA